MDDVGRWMSGLCVLLVALMMVPTVASAEAPSRQDIDDETAKEVLQLLRDGKKAYGDDEFQKAYDLFQQAYDKWPRPAILARLGKAAEQLGRKKEALKHYRAFLQENPDADIKDKIQQRVDELAAEVPAIVHLTSKPSGAEVYEGKSSDDKVGETPVELEVDPGQHTWSIRLEGYRNATRTVEVSGGQDRKLRVELEALGSQPTLMGSEETDEETESADARSGGGSPMAAWGWGTGIVGLAGVGTGGVFTYLQGRAVEQANNYQRGTTGATREELASLKDRAHFRHRVALVAYSAGGALAATGLGLLITNSLSDGGDDEASARVGPQFGFERDGGWAGLRIDF